MNKILRVGKISYLNIEPIFRMLERKAHHGQYRFVESFPARLNKMLRHGELDISPSSSIEYLRDKESYGILQGHSISSRGSIQSIRLFSRVPIEQLKGKEIHVTHQSETSVALLKILLRKLGCHDTTLRTTEHNVLDAIRSSTTYLAIGDDALMAYQQARQLDMERPENSEGACLIDNQPYIVYDIGDLWFRHMGVPAVFALWTYRKDSLEANKELFEGFRHDLRAATRQAIASFDSLAADTNTDMPAKAISDYWRLIEYGLPQDCLEGLRVFEDNLREMGDLP